jgi:hypothetical protein
MRRGHPGDPWLGRSRDCAPRLVHYLDRSVRRDTLAVHSSSDRDQHSHAHLFETYFRFVRALPEGRGRLLLGSVTVSPFDAPKSKASMRAGGGIGPLIEPNSRFVIPQEPRPAHCPAARPRIRRRRTELHRQGGRKVMGAHEDTLEHAASSSTHSRARERGGSPRTPKAWGSCSWSASPSSSRSPSGGSDSSPTNATRGRLSSGTKGASRPDRWPGLRPAGISTLTQSRGSSSSLARVA